PIFRGQKLMAEGDIEGSQVVPAPPPRNELSAPRALYIKEINCLAICIHHDMFGVEVGMVESCIVQVRQRSSELLGKSAASQRVSPHAFAEVHAEIAAFFQFADQKKCSPASIFTNGHPLRAADVRGCERLEHTAFATRLADEAEACACIENTVLPAN